jgi:hypothetical protein
VCKLSASPNNALADAISSASVVLLAVELCFFDDHNNGKHAEPVRRTKTTPEVLFDVYGQDAKSLSVYTSNVGAWSGSTAAA